MQAGLFPPNPEALLPVDIGVANPFYRLTTGGRQPHSHPAIAHIAAGVDFSTKAVRVECSGTHCLTTGWLELYLNLRRKFESICAVATLFLSGLKDQSLQARF